MDLMSRASTVKDRARTRMAETRLDSARDENDQLKSENRILKDELEQLRTDRERVMDRLERFATPTAPKVKRHRVRRLITLATAAGAAYVVGAKAGRERYEQIRGWWNQRMGRADLGDWDDTPDDMAVGATSGAKESPSS